MSSRALCKFGLHTGSAHHDTRRVQPPVLIVDVGENWPVLLRAGRQHADAGAMNSISDGATASNWYYATGDKPVGPVTLDHLSQLARRGHLKGEHFVWAEGMSAWAPASSISKLWTEPPPLPSKRLSAPVAKPVPAKDSWIIRHWQGRLPLVQSFWICNIVLGIAMAIVFAPALWLWEASGPGHTDRLIVARVMAAMLVVFFAWQFLGLWRSAGNHFDVYSNVWTRLCGYGARVFVMFACIKMPFSLVALLHRLTTGDW